MKVLTATIFLILCQSLAGFSQTLDTMTFGNGASETAHSLNSTYSDTFTGAFSQTARRLLPKPQLDVYGGEMTFAMAVDPVKQNFFTIKLWGTDANNPLQWLVLNINGLELGDRHGDFAGPNPFWFQSVSWATNTFIYRTVGLPLHLTRGKSSVTLKIRSLGFMSYYDSGPYFSHYQKLLNAPTVGIYRAYTHVGSGLDTSGETQGIVPNYPSPRTLENETTVLTGITNNVINTLAADLNKAASSLSIYDINYLAQCYDARENLGQTWINYPSGMTWTNLINQIIAGTDSQITKQSVDSSYINVQGNSSWGGYFGPLGDAIRKVWPQLSNSMSATVSFGGTYGTTTRQSGWSQGLRASVDSGRFNRQVIGNQATYNAENIYLANRGLQVVDPANAIAESNAVRYVREACGGQPWLGNDQSGGTPQVPIPGTPPYGPNWFMCTTKGTSKDINGFVGSDYGELGPWVYRLGYAAGDAQIMARGLVQSRARDVFRFPAADDSGYLVMQGAEPIGDRNNTLPGHYVYLGNNVSDDLLMATQGAGVVGADIVGYVQEQMNEGQLLRKMSGGNDPYLPMRYAAFKSLAQTGVKLPMAVGGPDFAWCDEENMVFGARHGEERIFGNLFWALGNSIGDRISGWAKVFHLTTNQVHLADVFTTDLSFRSSGQMEMGESRVEGFWSDQPPDNPVNAMNGVPGYVAFRSDWTNVPSGNRDGGRGTGYTFRYGNWLVGINANYATNLLGQAGSNYVVQLPAGFTTATNLIDGTVYTAPVVLPPKSSVVFYLPTNQASATPPSRSLFLGAQGGNGLVALKWLDADGATAYNVKRSNSSGGGYTTIASGVTNNFYKDTAVVNGTTYYYVVTGTNSAGEGGYSPEDSAVPLAPQTVGLATPWGNTNFTTTGGSASISGGTFTLTSPQGDIWSTSDGCHFVYQPMLGDGMVTVRVTGSSSANTYAKAGLMIRASLANNDVSTAVVIERVAGRVETLYRTYPTGPTYASTHGSGLTLPYWLRMKRSTGSIYIYTSPDGTNWTQQDRIDLGSALPYVAYVGICASPANGSVGQTTTATFDNVTFPFGAAAVPSTPTGLTVNGANLAAVLNWNAVSNAARYTIKRSLNVGGPFTNVATGVAGPPYTDYGLNNNTAYYYSVAAVNDLGESAASAVANATPVPPPALTTSVVAAGSNNAVNVSWAAVPGANSYNVYRSAYSSSCLSFSLLANVTATNFSDGSVTASSPYFYYVTALTNASESQWSGMVAGVAPGVPTPWTTRDIGLPDMPGYAFQTNGVFNLNAAGNDVWYSYDQLNFTFQTISNNCDIRARVLSVDSTSPWAKCGVMIRESLDPSAAYAFCFLTPVYGATVNGVAFQKRSGTGAASAAVSQTTGLTAPYWVRLTRTNSTFTAYNSANGVTWTSMGSTTITMSNTVFVGLALCGVLNNSINTSLMDQATIQPGPPYAPTGLTATPSDVQVAFTWNASAGATNYILKRATVSGGPYTAIATNAATTFVDTGLAANTVYYYVVSAVGALGEGLNSAEVSAKLLSTQGNSSVISVNFQGGGSAMAATENAGKVSSANWNNASGASGTASALNLNNGSATTASVSWSCNNVYSTPITDSPGDYRMMKGYLDNNPASTTTVTVTNLPAAYTNYGYLVYVYFDGSSGATVKTGVYKIGGTTINGTDGGVDFSGQYVLAYNSTGNYLVFSNLSAAGFTLTANTSAGDGSGGRSPVNAIQVVVNKPATPTGLSAVTTLNQVALSWNPVGAATSYNLKRSLSSGSNYVIVATVTGTNAVDAGLINDTTYYYVVSAVTDAGESANSTQVSATITAPPPVPTGVTALAGDRQMVLSWNLSIGATNYFVKRSTTNGGAYATVLTATGTNVLDTGLTNGTTYYYVVSAANAVGESTNSAQVSATPNSGIGVVLNWLGAVNGTWDTATTNWQFSGFSSIYRDGNTASFDDTALSNTLINISSPVSPASVVVNNSSLAYSFSGGAIAGSGSLVKQGSGVLTLSNVNTYTGSTTIGAGSSLVVGGAGQLGGGNYAGNISNNGSFNYASSANQTLTGTHSGAGTLTKSGLGTLTLSGSTTYSGSTAVNAGTLSITGSGSLASSSSINVASGATLTTSVNNTFGVGPTAPWTIGGTITGTANAQSMPPSVTLNNGTMSGTTFATYGTFLVPSAPVTITANGSNNLINAGNIGLAALLTVNTPNATDALAISSVLGASSVKSYGLTKTGNGTMTLSGANIYTGPTTVSGGKLTIATVFAGKGDFSVTNGATLGVTNLSTGSALVSNLTVYAGAAVEFQKVTNLTVPLMTLSNLTISGSSVVNITGTNGLAVGSTYPLVNYAGSFNGAFTNLQLQMPAGWGGVLVSNAHQIALTVIAPPAAPAALTATAGDAQASLRWNAVANATGYNVKSSTTNGGPYALAATLSATNSVIAGLSNGTLYYFVVTATNQAGESAISVQASARPVSLAAPNVAVGPGSGQLQLNWPADHTGWRLVMSTNLVNPNWTDVSSNLVTATNLFNVPVSGTNGSIFYRLVYP